MAGDAISMDAQLRTTKNLLEASNSKCHMLSDEIVELKTQIELHLKTIKDMEQKSHEDEMLRYVTHCFEESRTSIDLTKVHVYRNWRFECRLSVVLFDLELQTQTP
jgi:hypothetical protein